MINCIHCNKELFHVPVSSLQDTFMFSCGCLRFRTISDTFNGFQVMVDGGGRRRVTRVMWDGTARLSKFPAQTHIESFSPDEKYNGRYIQSTGTTEVPFPFDIETMGLERIKQFVKTVLLFS